jgi:hypothetical protein
MTRVVGEHDAMDFEGHDGDQGEIISLFGLALVR